MTSPSRPPAARFSVRIAFALLLAAAGLGPALAEAVPRYSIEDFLNTVNFSGASFSPDKTKILVSSDLSGIFNVYSIPVAGGSPTPLTASAKDSLFSNGYFPNDERLLISADQGGNELNHLYVRELDGTIKDLTPGEKHRAMFAGWAKDERSFYVLSNERDNRFFDLYSYAVDGYQRTLLYQEEKGLQFANISPDGRYLAFGKSNTTSDSDVFLYDRQAKELKNLTAHAGTEANEAQAFTPDGKGLLLTSDRGSEFASLLRYDLSTGATQPLVQTAWDVAFASYSRNDEFLVVLINHDARNELRIYRAATMEPVPLPALPGLDLTTVSFSRDGRKMAFYASSSRSPSDLFVMDMGAASPTQLTRSLNQKIDPQHLVEGEVVRFKSFDGIEVPGVLYKPHGASAASKVPAVVMVHGGPGGQSRIGYNALNQFLVNHGYALFAINNRGSSGYGKTFFQLDDKNHGQGDLGDCVESKKMLATTGWVDASKIAIAGGSYGGYMVLAALAFRPQEFTAGVDIFGVSNWVRTLKSIPPYWEAQRSALYKELGNPETEEDYLRKISPLFHAKNIVRPLMVLQGVNDPRVIKPESDEIVAAARANGTPVEYLVFDDEGHGFVKKENQKRAYQAIKDFLDLHVKVAGKG